MDQFDIVSMFRFILSRGSTIVGMDFDFVNEECERENDCNDGVDEEYFNNLAILLVEVYTRTRGFTNLLAGDIVVW